MELVRFTLGVRELIADGLIRHNKTIFDGCLLNETFARNTAKQLIINRTHPVE